MLKFELVWFLVLLANFLVLLFIMNQILFKPLLKLFNERDKAISGSLEEARDMEIERETELDNLMKEFSRGKSDAREKFEAFKQEGLDRQKQMLEKAQQEAVGILDSARAELRAESEKAREKLRSDVQRFSDEIVTKLVGAL